MDRGYPASGSTASAEIGTISMPRLRASATHSTTASTVTSKAEPMPTAKPLARAVRFLCSDAADYITGQVLNVDGGMVM